MGKGCIKIEIYFDANDNLTLQELIPAITEDIGDALPDRGGIICRKPVVVYAEFKKDSNARNR